MVLLVALIFGMLLSLLFEMAPKSNTGTMVKDQGRAEPGVAQVVPAYEMERGQRQRALVKKRLRLIATTMLLPFKMGSCEEMNGRGAMERVVDVLPLNSSNISTVSPVGGDQDRTLFDKHLPVDDAFGSLGQDLLKTGLAESSQQGVPSPNDAWHQLWPERRRLSTVVVSTFSALSSAIASDTTISVTGNISFTAVITISGKTGVKIYSDAGVTLTSDRSFTNTQGGMIYVASGSDVTLSGLTFESGSASGSSYVYGGCVYVTASNIDVQDSVFSKCYAYVGLVEYVKDLSF